VDLSCPSPENGDTRSIGNYCHGEEYREKSFLSAAAYMLSLLTFGGLTMLTLLCGYLWFLAALYCFGRKKSSISLPSVGLTHFAIVVPAHNEETGIAATIQSLKNINYPMGRFNVFVVADNCSDKTAEVARKAGAVILERCDDRFKGKGYALKFAFDSIPSLDYDAVIVVDADSVVNGNFLSGFDVRIRKGQKVIQALVGISNPDTNVLTYLFQVGNLIENKLYWTPKERLGLPILLRGNGMCFTRGILDSYPWDSFTIAEDTEYGLKLLEMGERIRFASEIEVFAHQPENLEQANIQRVRWASGNATLTKSLALRCIYKGIRKGDIRQIDVGVALLAGSKPLLLLANFLIAAFALCLGNSTASIWAATLLIGQVIYICLGIVMNGLSVRNMGRLLISPLYLVWLCAVSVLGLVGYRKDQWLRTTRL
jgi:cellulose synthase/poly-beta-1,6-N-acetylglucosamine synthase-like glycosyltransferase